MTHLNIALLTITPDLHVVGRIDVLLGGETLVQWSAALPVECWMALAWALTLAPARVILVTIEGEALQGLAG